MPKLKSHSGAKKRFSLTKSGKVRMSRAKRRHDIKGCKSIKKKRQLRKKAYLSKADSAVVKKLIPYG